ncbi:hypothetical protein [Amycolatopsis sp. CA-230715]|uniref:hypothetical protein n=1 Tax=Amycolatopsis sp. CA-230715 TaxID=2745196 RepID=UPI001C009282|nr:hypothetical protein [Amycolatopsis sp. CA-230715]QWF83493.1 hypothetical protein HUW46_06934 [Amycolatopsis sp. CA-230715]
MAMCLVTAVATVVTVLTGRRLWRMSAALVRSAVWLAQQRRAVALAVRVLAAGGQVELRVKTASVDLLVRGRGASGT